MKLYGYAEAFQPSGNITGQGIGNVLGAPPVDPVDLLVRESVQNVWDARREDEHPTASYHLRNLEASEASALIRLLGDMPERDCVPDLHESLSGPDVRILEIADWGTTGLGGPTSAAVEPQPGDTPDFVSFLRNIGSPRDTEMGGGTYGFGKSSIWNMSRCSTILVHTLCTEAGKAEERFIVYRVGGEYSQDGRRYTGRHWWGVQAEEGGADPHLGQEAAKIAGALGMPARSDGDFGTTIWVLDPVVSEDGLVGGGDPEEIICEKLRDAILVHCWPKMVQREGEDFPPMAFVVQKDGVDISIPDLEDCPPLGEFAQALSDVRSGSSDAMKIRCGRPVKHLGLLALRKSIRARRNIDSPVHGPGFCDLIPDPCNCVALMRPAELVVKYLHGPQPHNPHGEYSGVFVCDPEVEPAFATSEPPAHDSWNYEKLEGVNKTFVRTALRKVSEEIQAFVQPPLPEISDGVSTADVADRMGAVLLGAEGPGVGGAEATRPASSRSATPFKSKKHDLVIEAGYPCQVYRISHGQEDDQPPPGNLELRSKFLEVDGGGFGDPPAILRIEEEGVGDLGLALATPSEVLIADAPQAPLLVYVAFPANGELGVVFEVKVKS
jgi:hypothetical protein